LTEATDRRRAAQHRRRQVEADPVHTANRIQPHRGQRDERGEQLKLDAK
jgi:hypothetical protein